MLRKFLIATSVLALGLAIGCGDSKKGGQAPPVTPPPGGNPSCPTGQVWNATLNKCVGVNDYANDFDLYSSLNITNNKEWAKFLDDYFFSIGTPYCRVEGNLFWPVGTQDCETYTINRSITLNLNELIVSESGTTKGQLILTAGSSWGVGYYNIFLPVGTQRVTLSRIAINDIPDSGFQLQLTISGRNGPKIFRIRGNSINLIEDNGADIQMFYGAPDNLKLIGSASLYFYE
jgi:hypothetical protein